MEHCTNSNKHFIYIIQLKVGTEFMLPGYAIYFGKYPFDLNKFGIILFPLSDNDKY